MNSSQNELTLDEQIIFKHRLYEGKCHCLNLEFFASLFYGRKCSQRVPIWEPNLLLAEFFILSWGGLVLTPDLEGNSFWKTPVTKLLTVTKMWSYGSKVSRTLTLKHRLCSNKDRLRKALTRWVLIGYDAGWSHSWQVGPHRWGWTLREMRAQHAEGLRRRHDWQMFGPFDQNNTSALGRPRGRLRIKQALTHISLWPKR